MKALEETASLELPSFREEVDAGGHAAASLPQGSGGGAVGLAA